MKPIFKDVKHFQTGIKRLNPISTVIFFDAYVPGEGSVGPPLKMAFLLEKCANSCPEMKFGNILGRF